MLSRSLLYKYMGTFLFSAALPAAEALNSTTLVNSTACTPSHIVIARGTTEGYPGILESLAQLVTASNPDTSYESIIYPATQETDTDSYQIGRKASVDQITQYVERCPAAMVVLLAYSQGALIVGDAIAGGGGPGEALVVDAKYTRPLPKAIGDHIAAMVLYGNPRHMPNQAYDIFNKNATGKYPRTQAQLDALLPYRDRLHDHCNIGDPVCAGGDNLTAHTVYPEIWDRKAAAFVQGKLNLY